MRTDRIPLASEGAHQGALSLNQYLLSLVLHCGGPAGATRTRVETRRDERHQGSPAGLWALIFKDQTRGL